MLINILTASKRLIYRVSREQNINVTYLSKKTKKLPRGVVFNL